MTSSARHGGISSRLTGPSLMVVSGVSTYVGAAIAVELFPAFPPSVVAWLRMAGAALVLLALARPRRTAWFSRAGALAAVYGIVTAAMNIAFYEAIARIPMGTAVALEFVGPIVVAALGTRGLRQVLSLVSAVAGVALIANVQVTGNAAGFVWALVAAAMWAGYIVLGSRVAASAGSARDAMAVGFTAAAVAFSPVLLSVDPTRVASAGLSWVIVAGLAIGLGTLSTAVPYGLDQINMRRVGPGAFAILLAILPVVSALVGLVALGQRLDLAEVVGIVAIVTAVALRGPGHAQVPAVEPIQAHTMEIPQVPLGADLDPADFDAPFGTEAASPSQRRAEDDPADGEPVRHDPARGGPAGDGAPDDATSGDGPPDDDASDDGPEATTGNHA